MNRFTFSPRADEIMNNLDRQLRSSVVIDTTHATPEIKAALEVLATLLTYANQNFAERISLKNTPKWDKISETIRFGLHGVISTMRPALEKYHDRPDIQTSFMKRSVTEMGEKRFALITDIKSWRTLYGRTMKMPNDLSSRLQTFISAFAPFI
jgi:hypothetical protein